MAEGFLAAKDIVIAFSLLAGLFFLLVGAVGMHRLPDVFTRMHAIGKCDTLGTGLVLFAIFLLVPDFTSAVKVFLIGILIATINPVITHLVAKTAYDLKRPTAPGTWYEDNYSTTPDREERQV